MDQKDKVEEQYKDSEPLRVRANTHRLYSERMINLDAEAQKLMDLDGSEAVLDVGCGPGVFLRYLKGHGHTGRLVGLDQSLGMIAEAQDDSIEGFVGDAQQLPFEEGAFQRVSARHMLYHVPNIPMALEEMKRVLSSKGTVLVTTNSQGSLSGMRELRNQMLSSFGYQEASTADTLPINTFCIENADEILEAAFSSVQKVVYQNALIFRNSDPIAAYVGTMLSMLNIPNDEKLYAEMRMWLKVEAERMLRHHGGVWRDPKYTGFYVCS
ncbi:methyltransferase domain-containing protein [Paenibacillus sp. LMG 31456]|uniref:Methyltransferase domain-containing protein n=1 Tax=Paenibacillus foliorum TaxID=2654974 RepID=A0A972GJV9_9BACL|nr:class I SAM-dependent methyltransferase [Paenibacillus foliorum]NOU92104.1 methyltransferase domain-containing protein [Paenibacillus foliorum]